MPARQPPHQETRRERKERFKMRRGRIVGIHPAMAMAQFGPSYVGHIKAGNRSFRLERIGSSDQAFVIIRDVRGPGGFHPEQIARLRGIGRTTALKGLKDIVTKAGVTYNKLVYVSLETAAVQKTRLH